MQHKVIHDRFRLALIPALIMGIISNIYTLCVFILVDAFFLSWSPIISGVLFSICFILLKKNSINPKQTFLIAAYLSVIEICIHTHFLGWDSGFYYYLFLLSMVFLLNSFWKTWMIVFFNFSIAIVLAGLLFFDADGRHVMSAEIQSNIKLTNLILTGIIVLVIMIYFRRTVHKKDEALIRANLELERQNIEILEQHKHLQILLKEIHHRVKNNLQIISSLMSLQSRKSGDERLSQFLNESKRRVEAIALIHEKLLQDDKVNRVDFKSYLEELMNSQKLMNPLVKCTVLSKDATLDLDTAVPLGLIFSEMCSNSIKHAFQNVKEPELRAELKHSNEEEFELIVQDNGIGLPVGFDFNNPSSLGFEIINALTSQINGRIEYANDDGAKFHVFFPA